jgi:hypothetical protein
VRRSVIYGDLRRPLAFLVFAGPLVGAAVVVALGVVDRSLMLSLAREDSLIEWAQVATFVAGGAFALGVVRALRPAGPRSAALAFAVLAAGCFFVTGEELDWGQRIFGFETPRELEKVNPKDRTTLHHIPEPGTAFVRLQLLIGFLGSIGAWLLHLRGPGRAGPALSLLTPPLIVTSAFLLVFAYRAAGPLTPNEPLYDDLYGEYVELCLAFGLAAFAGLIRRRLRQREVLPPARTG